jgi:hypothetical protein
MLARASDGAVKCPFDILSMTGIDRGQSLLFTASEVEKALNRRFGQAEPGRVR